MKTYKYTDNTNAVVAIFDEDGLTRMSCLVEAVPPDAEIEAADPVAVAVPQVVTMRQARLALLGAGLLSGVNAVIQSLPSPEKEAATIEWEYAAEVQRSSGLVPAMAEALGMTDEQLDDLFIGAATL